MSAHAACSPSSANMWLACPASVTLTKDMTRPSSKFAREGTAAHAVAEMTLKGDIFLPDKVTVEGDEYIVSPGMCRALNPYVTHVEGLRALPGARRCSSKSASSSPAPSGMVWGTLDCGVHAHAHLHVADLKFGKGHVVDPEGPQLRLYALALAGHVSETRDNVQGHAHHLPAARSRVRRCVRIDTTLGDLRDWRDRRGHARRSQDQGRGHYRKRGPSLPLVRPQDRVPGLRARSIRATPQRRSTTTIYFEISS